MDKSVINTDIQNLYGGIAELIKQAKTRVAVTINAELAMLNWQIGKYINQFIVQGNRAAYGKQIIANLSVQLTGNFGSGWSEKQLMHFLRVAESFSEEQIVSALWRQLSWTHLKTIAYENDPLKRQFYLEMAISQRWNTRTLADQIDKMLYEHTAIAQQPELQIQQAWNELKAEDVINPDLFFKNTFILDFLELRSTYSEKDLEDSLVTK